MGETWSDIVADLRRQRLLVPQSLKEKLLSLQEPKSVINAATALNLTGGMLTASMLDEMILHARQPVHAAAEPQAVLQKPADDLARTIAPLVEKTNR